ncbi:galactokinase [Sesbania bispinosa]|nr:galactokinase [Sesbania bispinosa]
MEEIPRELVETQEVGWHKVGLLDGMIQMQDGGSCEGLPNTCGLIQVEAQCGKSVQHASLQGLIEAEAQCGNSDQQHADLDPLHEPLTGLDTGLFGGMPHGKCGPETLACGSVSSHGLLDAEAQQQREEVLVKGAVIGQQEQVSPIGRNTNIVGLNVATNVAMSNSKGVPNCCEDPHVDIADQTYLPVVNDSIGANTLEGDNFYISGKQCAVVDLGVSTMGSGDSVPQNEAVLDCQLCEVPIIKVPNANDVENILHVLTNRDEPPKKKRGRPKKKVSCSSKVCASDLQLIHASISQDPVKIAEHVWEIGKELGVSIAGSENTMIDALQALEIRDRKAIGRVGLDLV